MQNKEIEDSKKILDLMRRASIKEKATVTIDNLACKTFLQYIDQLENKVKAYDSLVEKIKKKKRYFEEYDKLIATSNNNYSDGTVIKRFIDMLQELLEEK